MYPARSQGQSGFMTKVAHKVSISLFLTCFNKLLSLLIELLMDLTDSQVQIPGCSSKD